MRKFISVLLGAALAAGSCVGLAACDGNSATNPQNGDVKKYDITVWAGDGTTTMMQNQVEKFNSTIGKELKVSFNAKVEQVSEGKAVGDAESHPESAADLFCFASDTFARAVEMNLVAKLSPSSVTFIDENNIKSAADASKMGDTYYAFPMTADNSYFLYYNKDKLKDTEVTDLETMIEVAEKQSAKISYNLGSEGSWYAASFFYGTGCKSEWVVNDSGKFTDMEDDFNSANGIKAFKGMAKLMSSECFNDSSKAQDFSSAIPSIAVVSGVWDYKTAKTILGDKLGVAPLPHFTVDGARYQATPYLGYKFMGIKPQSDKYKLLYLQRLAQYLTGEECQTQRLKDLGWGPSNLKSRETDEAKENEIFNVINDNPNVVQGQYPAKWWSQFEVACLAVKKGTENGKSLDDTALGNLLKTYAKDLATFLNG